jgi:small-conductance mechanosensitive channel
MMPILPRQFVSLTLLLMLVFLPALQARDQSELLDQASRLLQQYQHSEQHTAAADRLNKEGLQLISQLETCESQTEHDIARLIDIRTIEQLNAQELSQGDPQTSGESTQHHAGEQVVDQQLNQLTRQLVECRLKASQISQARAQLVEQQRSRWLDQLSQQQNLWSIGEQADHTYWGLAELFNAGWLWYGLVLLMMLSHDLLLRRQLSAGNVSFGQQQMLVSAEWAVRMVSTLGGPLALALLGSYLYQGLELALLWVMLLALLARDLTLRLSDLTRQEPFSDSLASRLLSATSGLLLLAFSGHDVWFYGQQVLQQVNHNGLGFVLVMLVLAILLIWTSRQFRRGFASRGMRWLMLLEIVLGVLVVLLLVFSYARAAQYVMTLALGLQLVIWVASAISGWRIATLKKAIERRRQTDKQSAFTFPFWVTLSTNLVLWLGALAFLSWLARISDDLWQNISFVYSEGFELGSVRIVPNNILIALLLVTVLVLLLSRVKSGVENRWFNNSGLGKASREVMSMVVWYCGLFIVIIMGLGVAGFDVSNLALIAGALSVGIGFGLQNIVSNFVSGLILLFERPVKNGDWVEVGDTVGLIEKVKIRATRIRTFDNAEILVPNSELLSHHVTNWTLSNSIGRITMKVGVAYGSDVQKVYDILDGIAKSHQQILQEAPYKHKVLFREFGDSSLNFELRVMIKDIKQILDVHSELNFAIERSLREAGITIPFPQRDVHLIKADSVKSDENDAAQEPADAQASTSNDRSGSAVEDLVKADQDSKPD